MDQKAIREIVVLALESVAEKLKEKSIQVDFSSSLIEHLAHNAYNPQYGARPLRRYIQKELETSLAKKLLSNEISEYSHIKISLEGNDIIIKKQ